MKTQPMAGLTLMPETVIRRGATWTMAVNRNQTLLGESLHSSAHVSNQRVRPRLPEFSSEVNVDVRYAIVGEFEMLDTGKTWPGGDGRPVPDQGALSVSADVQQREGDDVSMPRPAPFEVRGPVDPIVVRAGEGEARVKEPLDGRAVVVFVGLVVVPDQCHPVVGT
jgi:hypothetical protein